MKITFKGWSRQVMTHVVSIRPIPAPPFVYRPVEKAGSPMKWCSSLMARGKVENLKLGGDFEVQFEFEASELRNWLNEYVKAEPEAAIRLLAEMQAEATIALVKVSEDSDE